MSTGTSNPDSRRAGTLNEAGSIHEVVDMIMTYDGHSERILLAITDLGSKA